MTGPSNNGMQLTKAARCAPSAFRSWGQSLRAAFAADPGCCAYGGTISRGIALVLLLTICNPGDARPQERVTAVPSPPAKAPVKGKRAIQTWALAGSETQPLAAIKGLQELLSDSDKELRIAAAWAIGHLRVTETGEEAQAYDEAPRLEKQTKPVYPEDAYRQGIQGVVLVDFVIDEAGRVAHVELRASIPPLDKAALAFVKKWRFTPAKLGGKAVPAKAVAPVSFKIDK